MNTIQYLLDKKVERCCPPYWLPDNIQYEVVMGSVAYGVSTDRSDIDLYGFCIPPKEIVFPHLAGHIDGFGRQKRRFEQWQQHHLELLGTKHGIQNYDITIYNIVKYFSLVMENNPNMVDSLFVPQECVLTCTQLAQHVREHRRMFLHKGCWHKFKGYAFSQVKKMKSQTREGKRKELVEEFGYDVKFAYHVIRLIDEVEQILTTGDLNLQRAKEHMKAVRRGEWTVEQVEKHFADAEERLEKVYQESDLQYKPDEAKVKNLLLECLEMHYGSITVAEVVVDGVEEDAIRQIANVIRKVQSKTKKSY